jgi:hypothetical protein
VAESAQEEGGGEDRGGEAGGAGPGGAELARDSAHRHELCRAGDNDQAEQEYPAGGEADLGVAGHHERDGVTTA